MAVTLPPGANRVKRATAAAFRAPVVIASFALASALAVALVAVALRVEQSQRMDRFGEGMARMAAQLALPHMLQQRRTELEGLARRIAALDQVAGCGFYTVDDRALAVAGREWRTPGAPQYSRRVTVDETVAGRARIVVERSAFATGTLTLLAALWPLWLIVGIAAGTAAFHATRGRAASESAPGAAAGEAPPGTSPEPPETPKTAPPEAAGEAPAPDTAAAAAEAMATAHRSDEAQTKGPPIAATDHAGASAAAAPVPGEEKPAPSPADAEPALVLVANLFNRAELTRQTAAAELSSMLRQARRLAKASRGRAAPLPDAGVCIRFNADQVEGVEAVRAALELAKRKALPGSKAQFRVALHRTGNAGHGEADAVAAATQLSVLAPAGKVAVSEAAFAAVARPERLNASDVPEAAVTALAASSLGRCRIVQGEEADADAADAVSPAGTTE